MDRVQKLYQLLKNIGQTNIKGTNFEPLLKNFEAQSAKAAGQNDTVKNVMDALSPLNDPTRVFAVWMGSFSVFYFVKSIFFGDHPHQHGTYPYMKSKRRTLAFMFEGKN
ncbi:hypothetical protein CYY_004999 [Polysphondylium violaceum]|uniref:Uncharacterized protein n=1 Tax=Polysphondylium violaceum TaxID=133409 RepID=A0A8J4V4M1_9MYCE|nr:hypothetical protein CYY_004999 [Polysphondylium violaceum]